MSLKKDSFLVSLIIPTLTNTSGLKYLLNYFSNKRDYQLVIIDNKPDKKKKELILSYQSKNNKEKIVYLPQNQNLGFAKAVNLGAKYTNSDWLLILNDDIEFEKVKKNNKKEIIQELLHFAKKNNFQAVAPVLRNLDGRVENYGYKILPFGKIELINKLNSDIIDSTKLDGLTAAFLLIKKNIFEKLNGFDESFFAYLEDVEFFIRFKKAGYRFALIAYLEVLHHHQKTSKNMGSFKARLDLFNWWRISLKHKDKFNFNLKFFEERLRNLSGYIRSLFFSLIKRD